MTEPGSPPDPAACGSETAAGAFPPIEELLPHRGPAVLLARVLAHDGRSTTCEVDVARSRLYQAPDGSVPAHVALEYMAQAIAAHGGLLDRAAGRDPRPGFFLGSRRLTLAVSRLEQGEKLEVTATHVRGAGRMLAFDCAVRRRPPSRGGTAPGAAADGRPGASRGSEDDGRTMVSGVLTVYLLESVEALTREFLQDDPES